MTQVSAAAASLCDDDGGASWPPGFRFHPTDEELVLYYLKRKVCKRRIKLDVIGEVDVYKWDPEELPGLSLLKTGDRQWFFFSPRDKKYPKGLRANRATRHGYWKATGKDRSITCNSRTVGLKKTLVFYKGRAPGGERTDWVMHEYTVDDDELNRCQNVQDYYALCKVYKKSGPGPKNGEQYGAPFREEDWADDENCEVSNPAPQDNHTLRVDEVTSVDVSRVNPPPQIELHELEEIMNQWVDDPATEQAQENVDSYLYALAQGACQQDAQSSLWDPSCIRAIPTESCVEHPQNNHQSSLTANFETTTSSASQLEMYKIPQPTFVPSAVDLQQHIAEEDFLEMDDLFSPVAVSVPATHVIPQGAQTSHGALPSSQVIQTVGVDDLDLYYDADVFLHELVPGGESSAILTYVDQAAPSQPFSNAQDIEFPYYDDYAIVHQHPASVNSTFVTEQWIYDQSRLLAVSTPVADEAATSGVNYAGISLTNATHPNQGNDAEEAEPWLTAALWSFIESIPSNPASAAESVLANRAFERVSSFSRLKLDDHWTTLSTGIGSSRGRMKGFFFFALLGVLLAIFCVVIDMF
ncbi:NAC domain-containing protein [Drosera capensis]